jgi:hypothetical protein
MMRGACWLLAVALVVPQQALAQMKPHRAEYSLRLGTAANAPRVGMATQDITFDCAGWRLKREVTSELALTPTLKFSLVSRLNGEEERSGNAFRYRTVQILNGAERETHGEVRRLDGETRVEIVTPDGSERLVLPPQTLLPIAAVDQVVDRLGAGAASFPVLMFGAEATGAAFRLAVRQLDPDTLPTVPPSQKPVTVPAGRAWPVLVTVTRPSEPDKNPLLTVRARILSSGVLERLVVDAGPVTVAAYLQSLEMHPVPACLDR